MKKLVENRPWGNFVEYTHNEVTTIKILTVNPGQELSLQYHAHRKEFWRILKGNPSIVIGEKKVETKPGDEFEVSEGAQHQISAGKDGAEILEISFGDFDEQDIVRIKDKYGRT